MRLRPAAIVALLSFASVAAAGLASCAVDNGVNGGVVSGSLNVPNCWQGPYNLQPNFYAATPYLNTLELRIQNGGDYETFSDGVEILVDDTTKIIPHEYGEPLSISLPVGVSPVGVPLAANENPSNVHLSVYLQATCQIQDVALYALDAVTLNSKGSCDVNNGGTPVIVCPGSTSGLLSPDAGVASADAGTDASTASPEAGTPADGGDAGPGVGASDGGDAGAATVPTVGHSSITFTSLYDGDPNAVSAPERLNQGTFTAYLADPRETCPGGVGPPPPCRGFLQGSFSFYFERGRPAQPFP
jgi:hypothetical protein